MGDDGKRRTLIPVIASASVGEVSSVRTSRVRMVELRTRNKRESKTGQGRPVRVGKLPIAVVCMSIAAEDLEAIDEAARRIGLNRSAYLASCGLACAGKSRAEIEIGAWAQRRDRGGK
jgi:hypothetical protein